MSFKSLVVWVTSTVVLASCGGGGGAGAPLFAPDSGSSAVTVSKLTLAVANPAKLNNGDPAGAIVATATAVDASGKTLPAIPVAFNVSGGIYTQTSTVTDANGLNVANILMGSDKSNRTVVVTATSGSITSAPVYISVIGAKISSVASPAVVAPSGTGTITFSLKDSSSTAVALEPIEVRSASGLVAATGRTDTNGDYVYSFTAPSTSGTVTATATALGVSASQDILVQSTSTTIPVVTDPITASIEINPSVVSINASGSTVNKATVRVLFKNSATNAALKNVRVKFDLNGDTNSVGGSFSVPDAYSDNEGYAVTSYIPSTLPSPTGGLSIRACYSASGESSNACTTGGSKSVTKAITVVASSVSITAGTDEKIGTDQDLVYYKRYVVQVVDASGFPKANVPISIQLNPVYYAKGSYHLSGDKKSWTLVEDDSVPPANQTYRYYSCLAEDANGNSFLDTGEDLNNNTILDPRRADASVDFEDKTAAGGKTDANGRVIVRVTYLRSVASWETVALSVSGSVDGSEGRTVKMFTLPVPADILTTVPAAPAFVVSPYGVVYQNVTLNADRVMPNGTNIPASTTLTPCQNPD